jgi:hypothetical protein
MERGEVTTGAIARLDRAIQYAAASRFDFQMPLEYWITRFRG